MSDNDLLVRIRNLKIEGRSEESGEVAMIVPWLSGRAIETAQVAAQVLDELGYRGSGALESRVHEESLSLTGTVVINPEREELAINARLERTGDGGQDTVTTLVNHTGVAKMTVALQGSGAIDNITIATDIPDYVRQALEEVPKAGFDWTAEQPADWREPWDDWLSLVNSKAVANLTLSAGGDWSQYVIAAVLRLQKKFAAQKLRGFDMFVSGDIPIAAGLSSSSALVVGTAEAMVTLNGLNTFPSQFVDLCGEGEWFVGTRGGSADHAAIKMGEKGKVVQMAFLPFAVQETVPFPRDYVLAVCDSGVKAHKTTNARDQFNHRVACYRLGAAMILQLFPQYAPLVHHLRDVNPRTLGVPVAWIYKILLHLPEKASREELRENLGSGQVQPLFESHNAPEDGLYPIRGVVMYGLTECERSRRFPGALQEGRIEEIGRLMNTSHDGDRVARFGDFCLVAIAERDRPLWRRLLNIGPTGLMEIQNRIVEADRRLQFVRSDVQRIEAAKREIDGNLNLGLTLAVLFAELLEHAQEGTKRLQR